ncbi:hypothetical protein ACPWSR_07440 [Alloiococcus sp. CFN-8]|uniref:hypothetical protein n=1 Tax=Alloiococcus sp. CFN-8 TaxID=3416081 RepID=UPI003CF8A929
MEIAYSIFIIIAVALLFWMIFGKRGRGEFLLILEKNGEKKKRRDRTLSLINLVLWSALLVFMLIFNNEEKLYMELNLIAPVIGILGSTFHITKNYGTSEMREKGITIYNSFLKYTRITSYQWMEGNVLRLNYKNIFRQDDFFEIELQGDETVLKSDELLEKYIHNKI